MSARTRTMVSVKYAVRLDYLTYYMGPLWRAEQIAEGLRDKYGPDRVTVEAIR